MTAQDFEQPAEPSTYGQQRRAAWQAGLRAKADDMTQASMQAHQADHAVVTAGQAGIFGHASGQDLAADVAARRRVGDGAGAGRELVAQGGTYDFSEVSDSPAPPRADLRDVNAPGLPQTGKSPLLRYMEGR